MSKKLNVVLIAILFLAFILRIFYLEKIQTGTWYDDSVSLLVANGHDLNSHTLPDAFTNQQFAGYNTFSNVLKATIADNGNSFLFNVVLHYWLIGFGNSDTASRLLSVLFGILLIPLSFFLSRKIFKNNQAAMLTALLVSLHPLFISYAHQTRAYTMATFFTLLSSYFFYELINLEKNKFVYLFYALSCLASLLSHYLTVYILIAHAILFPIFIRSKKIWLNYFLTGLIILLLFLGWMLIGGFEGLKSMKLQNSSYALLSQNYTSDDLAFFVPATPKNIFTGWIQIWLPIFGNQFQNFGFRIREIGGMLLVPFLLFGMAFRNNWNNAIILKKIIFLVTLIFIHTLFVTVLAIQSGHCISFQPLYGNFAAPYAMLFLGFVFQQLFYERRRKTFFVIFFCLIVSQMLISTGIEFYVSRNNLPANYLYFDSAKKIEQQYFPSDTVVFNNEQDAKRVNLYLSNHQTILEKIDKRHPDLFYIESLNK